MIKVVAHVTALQGHQEHVKGVLLGLLGPTRAEPGCRFYDLHVGADPQVFTFIEAWDSDDDLDLHLASDHIQEALVALRPHLAGSPDIRRYVQIEVGD